MANPRREFIAAVGTGVVGLTVGGCLDTDTADHDLPALVLTWQRDPTTTMTIDWHVDSSGAFVDDPDTLEYRADDAESDWRELSSSSHSFDQYDRRIHRVELTGLEPGTTYEFQVESGSAYRFRTMPVRLDDPLTFAAGGDTDASDWDRIASELLAYDPEFLVIGGDFAYADGGTSHDSLERWHRWLETANQELIDEDGRVVPIVSAIGNHETRNGYYHEATRQLADTDEWREWYAPYFYNVFAFPGHPGYGVLDFGEYLSMPVLDSNHTNTIDGTQTEWLEDVLEERSETTHVIPAYHVPAWPSHREIELDLDQRSQFHWCPLFERADVRFALESHDHTFKRTHPLLEGERDEDGIVYVGDGCMGRPPREADADRWYIDEASGTYNCHIVTIDETKAHVETIRADGGTLDEVSRDVV
ncbi:fibronectin type III domain-containing protein [Halostagnicola sp. A-GB9-2]|uniref:fibronectin type III domain-containing protein n=1 Tax=Halostagnicola sp. A-GB9-2 TaxID=3048066 RepID=UPI0024BF1905|nr:fibronectin type III domain-containing protein [Halostagnicola sp. A-GB9-2]MDJ1430504.1 fibronectin type III domain-containing protein [Halostagnicola sp. A-GB9-2]